MDKEIDGRLTMCAEVFVVSFKLHMRRNVYNSKSYSVALHGVFT